MHARIALSATLAMGLAGLAVTQVSFAQAPSTPETLYVDSYSPANLPEQPGPIASRTVLAAGQQYTLTVKGTYSSWVKWSPVRCGRVEPAPLFASPAQTLDTPVGKDAEIEFAQPATSRAACRAMDLPQHRGEFQINLGAKWVHPEPDGGAPTRATRNHTYTYTVTGQGNAVRFRILDHHWQDNNGRLQVKIAQ